MIAISKLACGCAIAALIAPVSATAQTLPVNSQSIAPESEAGEQPQANDIIVNGAIVFRNRTEEPNPVLSYDLEYFQRFEPVSVGEMLKRVPGVTFTSDVLEYDGVQISRPAGRLHAGAHQWPARAGRRGGSQLLRRSHPRRTGRTHRDRPLAARRPAERGRRRHAQHHHQGGRDLRRRLRQGRRADQQGRRGPSVAGRRLCRQDRRQHHLLGRAELSGAAQPQEEGFAALR